MNEFNIKNMSPGELVDIRNVNFDNNVPHAQRMKHYINETKGYPNSFRCGKSVVLMRYKESHIINDRLTELIINTEKY